MIINNKNMNIKELTDNFGRLNKCINYIRIIDEVRANEAKPKIIKFNPFIDEANRKVLISKTNGIITSGGGFSNSIPAER